MALNDPPLDATIDVVTPENIAFEYRLAGPFRRLPAFLLDFFVGTLMAAGLNRAQSLCCRWRTLLGSRDQ